VSFKGFEVSVVAVVRVVDAVDLVTEVDVSG
jgi:hypothetical protein